MLFRSLVNLLSAQVTKLKHCVMISVLSLHVILCLHRISVDDHQVLDTRVQKASFGYCLVNALTRIAIVRVLAAIEPDLPKLARPFC